MDDVLNLAQVKAELSYLNRLDERRETNVASLKRLKEARDALLGRGSEVAGAQPHEDSSAAAQLSPSLRANGSRECAPDDGSAKQSISPLVESMDCLVACAPRNDG